MAQNGKFLPRSFMPELKQKGPSVKLEDLHIDTLPAGLCTEEECEQVKEYYFMKLFRDIDFHRLTKQKNE